MRREASTDQKIDEIQTMNQQQIDDMNSQFGATSKKRQSEVEQVMQQQLRHHQVQPPTTAGRVKPHLLSRIF